MHAVDVAYRSQSVNEPGAYRLQRLRDAHARDEHAQLASQRNTVAGRTTWVGGSHASDFSVILNYLQGLQCWHGFAIPVSATSKAVCSLLTKIAIKRDVKTVRRIV